MKQQSFAFVDVIPENTDKWYYETNFINLGYHTIAGLDEAGRGTLCGPVVAAAVILEYYSDLKGVDDSKKLSPAVRESLFDTIREKALAVGIGLASHIEVDHYNILEATRLAMYRAINRLSLKPDLLLTDAVDLPKTSIHYQAIIHGDALSMSISAASIIAKVVRDRIMTAYHNQFPQFQFNRNKGYATKHHLKILKRDGPCKIHRKTFKGVREFFE